MLTNTQLQYLAYGVMVLVVLVLVMNVFITKISNNYNNNTFEAFGNREGLTNAEKAEDAKFEKNEEAMVKTVNENINKMVTEACDLFNPNSAADMINELAKLKAVYGMMAADEMYNYMIKPAKDQDSQGWANSVNMESIIKMINTIDVISSSIKEYKFDCNSSVNISKLKSTTTTKGNLGSNKKKKSSWF